IGEHTVVFGGLGERIEITHKAHTRDTFVRGAIRAAKFIIGKPPGMYSMADVLQIKS
ncbi:MAG TPA: dihydrodipicolinate reductase C-terminal domain-containing protein, partial [Candidatus Wujingus californicus]